MHYQMNNPIRELTSIEFGILSPEEIISQSCFEVTNAKRINDNLYNSCLDPRSGSLSKLCETCNQDVWNCPGHFGHIKLNTPIFHPLFLSYIVTLLKVFCHYCGSLLVDQKHLIINNISKLTKEDKMNAVLELVKKCDTCFHCKLLKVDYKIVVSPDSFIKSINMIHRDREETLSVVAVQDIFNNICDTSVDLLNITHPKLYILTVLPVIPLCCRPYMIIDGAINDDDLTYQLTEIVKNNQNILLTQGDKQLKCINNLNFRYETMVNNSQSKAVHQTTGRAIKGLRERIAGKDGRIRKELLGKRTGMSGRTVAGPDPTLRLDEMMLPEYIANTQYRPPTATSTPVQNTEGREEGGNIQRKDNVQARNTRRCTQTPAGRRSCIHEQTTNPA
jgi:DNA-directed RNA polymerase beta' subunit